MTQLPSNLVLSNSAIGHKRATCILISEWQVLEQIIKVLGTSLTFCSLKIGEVKKSRVALASMEIRIAITKEAFQEIFYNSLLNKFSTEET